MPKITITCAVCGSPKSIESKEHNRQLRNGRQNFFCSKSCAGKFGNIQRWGVKEVSHPPEDSVKTDADSKCLNNIKKITLETDEAGQFMPHEWVREQIISLYPDMARFPMPSAAIDQKRKEWNTEGVIQDTSSTESMSPRNDLEEIALEQQPDEGDDFDFREHTGFPTPMEWEKGSPAMDRFWNKAIAEQQDYEDSKLPFTAGELSLKEEMSRAAAEALETDSLCAGAYEEDHEQAALKVMNVRKARIYEAEIMASYSEE